MASCVRVRALVLAGLLAASACGGDDGNGDGDDQVQSITTTATTTPAADRQALLDAQRTSSGAPGTLALVREGDDEWLGTSGVADTSGAELGDNTRFRIGSVTKPIVAFLVLDAVNRGELSLDDIVADLIPGVLDPDPPTTVRMLLDHSSGIFNVGDEGDIVADIAELPDAAMRAEASDLGLRYLAGERVSMSDRIFVALADTHDRYFEPGTGSHYSNVNYQLAAMVLEQVTGTALSELLRARLVEPLGLEHTTIAPADPGLPEMHGYRTDPDGATLVDITADFLALGNGGSGGIISTADELVTIMQAIVSGELLPEPLVAEMKRATPQSGGTYGLGLATYHLFCGDYYGHGGATSGTHTIAVVSHDGSTGVAIATNLRGDPEPNLLALAEGFICGNG